MDTDIKPCKVFITGPFINEAIDLLKKECEVIVSPKPPNELTPRDIIEYAKDADALLVVSTIEQINREVVMNLPKLKIIARNGVGYDNVDVQAATERGIPVTIAPVLQDTVADHVFGLIICLARKICSAHIYVKTGKWNILDPIQYRGIDITGKTIGIIGLGRIGVEVARRAKGFKMRILYYDTVRKHEIENSLGVEYCSLDELLRESDFVVIAVPLTRETYHMIGRRELSLMKKTAFLINIARGPVVDHDALVEALRENRIAGAGLDVYDKEPLPIDDPLLTLDNVILTPHIASNTYECRRRMAITTAEEILRVVHGEKPKYAINI